MAEKERTSNNNHLINFLFGLLSIIALGTAIYMVFFSNSIELNKEGLYWFIASLVCVFIPVIIPHIKEFSLILPGGGTIKLAQELESIDQNLKQIKQSLALEKVFEYLGGERDFSDKEVEEIKKSIRQSPLIVREAIFSVSSSLRSRIVQNIIHAGHVQDIDGYRVDLKKFISVFELLIDADRENPEIHSYKAQLAYLYKDLSDDKTKGEKDWLMVYQHIQEAIEYRDGLRLRNLPFTIYEFNRLVCGIHLSICPSDQIERDFNKVWNDTSTRFMLFETAEIIAPGLKAWVAKHKAEKLQEWENSKSQSA